MRPKASDLFHYEIEKERLNSIDCGRYITYGIVGYTVKGGVTRRVTAVQDVSTDRALVLSIVRKCNREQLFPIHLIDVIEDELE